jgi:DNA-binding MarR family transcriptional regulator
MRAKTEQRILNVLTKHGALTERDIQRWTKLAYGDITPHLETLTAAGVVRPERTSRSTRYRYVQPGEESQRL